MNTYEKWIRKKVLITVRTYPTPSRAVVEASCTAGICDGKWIRLFPVPHRLLDNDKRFRKYQYIEVDTIKAPSDPRPESHKINVDSIKILTEPITRKNNWQVRKSLILPLSSQSLCSLYSIHEFKGEPTLGIFKPREIIRLTIKKSRTTWTESQQASLHQSPLFGSLPKIPLEKLPYDFFYEFQCDDPNCPSHRLTCTDWEMGELYLKCKAKYGNNWEKKFRETYEDAMINKKDTYFYVGTVHGHPKQWIIIGLFYPRKSEFSIQNNLF
jgi:hypothetical protein